MTAERECFKFWCPIREGKRQIVTGEKVKLEVSKDQPNVAQRACAFLTPKLSVVNKIKKNLHAMM